MKTLRRDQLEEHENALAIAGDTRKMIQTSTTTIASIQPVASHADTALVNVDSITAHGDHIAAHYDKVLTAPKRWWQHITEPLETFGAKVAAGIL